MRRFSLNIPAQVRRQLSRQSKTENVLVMNCGSSSIKWQVVDPISGDRKVVGQADRLNSEKGKIKWKKNGISEDEVLLNPDYMGTVDRILEILKDSKFDYVGHRVVHGGEVFKNAAKMDTKNIEKLSGISSLAPLHNPIQTEVVKTCCLRFPKLNHGAVFDTSFHSQMPPHTYLYPLPLEWHRTHHVRRYGFHGLSHQHAAEEAANILGRPLDGLAIVSCHLGAGCSIAATLGGVSKDTSMGFSPLEGLMMGQRCGNIDASIVPYMSDKLGLSSMEILKILNTQSGFLAIGGTSDSRDLEDLYLAGDERATLAIDMFCYQVAKYVASYSVSLGRIDAIVFTGGIGEKSFIKRKKIMDHLQAFKIDYDEVANNCNGKNSRGKISTCESEVEVLVVKADEEIVIAKEVLKLFKT